MPDKQTWLQSLQQGDKVLTNYGDVNEPSKTVTIQEIIVGDTTVESRISVVLEEIEPKLDSFWINPLRD